MKRLLAALALVASIAAGCGGGTSAAGVSPSADTPGGGGSPAPPSADAGGCDGAVIDGIEVTGSDLLAYPPYAVAACSLVYISTAGDLVLRDLSSGRESVLASASGGERPRRPAISEALVAWEGVLADATSVVNVLVRESGEQHRLDVPGSASEPRVHGESVSLTVGEDGQDMDVWLWERATGRARLAIGGAGQQRFSDVSEGYVAATDFSEDPDGVFDGQGDRADVVVLDRATGSIAVRKAPGKQAFPMLVNGGLVAYLEWVLVHPEPKLEGYDLRVGAIGESPASDRSLAHVAFRSADVARPAASSTGTIAWIENADGRTTLWRAPADGSAPPSRTGGLDGLLLYAPAATTRGVVVATRSDPSGDRAPRLRSVTH